MSKHAMSAALSMREGARRAAKQPKELASLTMHEGENGGHIVEHHFESGMAYHEPERFPFGKHEGAKPVLPKGHVLEHIAKHMNIPHETMHEEKLEEKVSPGIHKKVAKIEEAEEGEE